ncbi:hypothetical protein AB9K17_23950, partial [Salmonella enterica subsp. enterica serovar Kentucky]|uniref:hypothetical protein n=1 Tax=Salmonella enterica TaxID=28901 RepID=UPI003F4C3DB7
VWDDDAPELSIGGAANVEEADNAMATFPVTALAIPSSNTVTVNYTPSVNPTDLLKSPDHTSGTSQTQVLNFNGSKTASLTVNLADNST